MKNHKFSGTVIDYTHDGKGVMKCQDYPIFVKDTIVGEEVEAKIIKWKKKYGFGKALNIITPNPGRVEPPCPYFYQCGGCQIQFMDYNLQKEFKIKRILNTYAKQKIELDNIEFIENDREYNYRNKLSIPLIREEGMIKAGLYRENSNDIVCIEDCLIQEDNINELLTQVLETLNLHNINVYDKKTHKGYLRQIVIRNSKANDEMLLGFVVNDKKYNGQLDYAISHLVNINKKIKTVVINLNNKNTNVILGDKNEVVYGEGYIIDTMNDLKFRISINSFFQVNTTQTDKLYKKAIEMAQLNENDVVLDAYCGVGTISSYIAKDVKQVVGVDIVEAAIEDAKSNQELNHIDNIEFICQDVSEYMSENLDEFTKIILDPPRKGASQQFLDDCINMSVNTIVYIACDPATQARDVRYLIDNGFKINEVCAVDMFSQTHHVETVVLISRVNTKK